MPAADAGASPVQQKVEFKATDGTLLRAWWYEGLSSEAKRPTIVMAHGLSAVKEMALDSFAEEFARNGFNALVFDNRNFGESEGQPRGEIQPWLQVSDYSDAISYAITKESTDPDRVGGWGSSYSGGNVIVATATDKRIKCAVSQVALLSGSTFFGGLPAEGQAAMRALFAADRSARFKGEKPVMLPVVAKDNVGVALPTDDSFTFFDNFEKKHPGVWTNAITARSVELTAAYNPGDFLPLIAPTPLLMVAAEHDSLVPSKLAKQLYEEKLGGTKKFVMLDCGHFDPYEGDWFGKNSKEQVAWFKEHLAAKK
ncbi:peptidase S15 [Hyaloraphidium curvatum]|nr:peptidase S15 [Hyaloraphidium curvatum]